MSDRKSWWRYAAAAPALSLPWTTPIEIGAALVCVNSSPCSTISGFHFSVSLASFSEEAEVDVDSDGKFDFRIHHNVGPRLVLSFPYRGTSVNASSYTTGANFNKTNASIPSQGDTPATQHFAFGLANGGLGWIHVETLFNGNPLTVTHGYADHDLLPIGGIHVGSTIPEPGSFAFLGMLATGAAGVAALKKYRREQHVDETEAEVV